MQPNECAKIFLETIPKAIQFIRVEMRDAAKSELTVPQFRIMIRLAKAMSTNLDLAESIGVHPSTMTRMMDPLVERKLVVRGMHAQDRRYLELSLTEEGDHLVNEVQKKIREKLGKKISELSAEKRNVLVDGLDAIKELLAL